MSWNRSNHIKVVCILVETIPVVTYSNCALEQYCSTAIISRYSQQHVLLEKTKSTINEEIVSIPVGFFPSFFFLREKLDLFELERL